MRLDWLELLVFGFAGIVIGGYGLVSQKEIYMAIGVAIISFAYLIIKIDVEIAEVSAELRCVWRKLEKLEKKLEEVDSNEADN